MSLPQFDYLAPRTIEEAVAARQRHGSDALIMAGGLTIVILLRERLVRPKVVLSLSEIGELRSIEADEQGLRIGAMVTHDEITRSRTVRSLAPLLAKACGEVGSPVIRNMGTLGGNISHGDSASDPAPALLALDAKVVLVGPGGERRVALKDFFRGALTTALDDNEVLTAIHIPSPAKGMRSRYMKFMATSAEAFSTVTVAIALTRSDGGHCGDVRIGLGSVAPTPVRAMEAERMLCGHKLSPELISDAAKAAMASTDPSSTGAGSAEYRRDMTGVWVRRLLGELRDD